MIVQMKRLTLVAHKTDERAIVDALQPLGAVEVQKDESASFCADQLAAAETRVQKLGDALNVLKPYGEKQGLLAPQPERTLAQISSELPEALRHSEELAHCQQELQRIRSEMEKNTSLIESLRPWEAFPADMQTYRKSKAVRYFPGMIEAADVEKLDEQSDAI